MPAPSCRKIDGAGHADLHWVRPESKSRVITIEQMRELMQEIHLKPSEAEYKVAVIEAADRLNPQSGNAFLKTLEEPPAKSVLILAHHPAATDCGNHSLRAACGSNFAGEGGRLLAPAQMDWLTHPSANSRRRNRKAF